MDANLPETGNLKSEYYSPYLSDLYLNQDFEDFESI